MEYYNVSIMEERVALKICQVCAVDFTVEKFLTPLIDGMVMEGWDITTVCSNGALVSSLRDQGYKIHTLPIARSMNPIKALRSIYLLYKYFKKSNFDLIHVHTPVASLIARIAVKFSKTKSFVIYTAHGFYFHDEMPKYKRLFFVFLEKIAGKYTDMLFCQSKEDAIVAEMEGIMASCDIITIGNGIDPEKYDYNKYQPFFNDIRMELEIPIDAKVIGIVARMVKEKGYIEFLQAAVNLKSKHPNVYFLLIGGKLESDHDSGIINALSDTKNQLKEYLIDLGPRNDVPRLISIMDIFCLPSYREGMPRTIIEAMFLKKPVVATNIRGCREEVIHGKTGLLTPIKNVIALTEALDYLLINSKSASLMGENGYQIALNQFNEKNIIAMQIALIKKNLGV